MGESKASAFACMVRRSWDKHHIIRCNIQCLLCASAKSRGAQTHKGGRTQTKKVTSK